MTRLGPLLALCFLAGASSLPVLSSDDGADIADYDYGSLRAASDANHNFEDPLPPQYDGSRWLPAGDGAEGSGPSDSGFQQEESRALRHRAPMDDSTPAPGA